MDVNDSVETRPAAHRDDAAREPDAERMPLVYVIVLTWNGSSWIGPCLQSLLQTAYPRFEIVVVDNGSSDDTVSVVEANFPSATVIRNGRNLGFAEGNNVGFRHALAHGAEAVAILNQDLKVDPDWLMELVQISRNPGIGLIGSAQFTYDGRELDEKFTRLLAAVGVRAFDVVDGSRSTPIFLPRVNGAAMFLRREVLETVGGLDPVFFLYHEETDFCMRVRHRGLKICAAPLSRVYHWHSNAKHDGKWALKPWQRYLFFRNEGLNFLKDPSESFVRRLHAFFASGTWRSLRRKVRHHCGWWAASRFDLWIVAHLWLIAAKRRAEARGAPYL